MENTMTRKRKFGSILDPMYVDLCTKDLHPVLRSELMKPNCGYIVETAMKKFFNYTWTNIQIVRTVDKVTVTGNINM